MIQGLRCGDTGFLLRNLQGSIVIVNNMVCLFWQLKLNPLARTQEMGLAAEGFRVAGRDTI